MPRFAYTSDTIARLAKLLDASIKTPSPSYSERMLSRNSPRYLNTLKSWGNDLSPEAVRGLVEQSGKGALEDYGLHLPENLRSYRGLVLPEGRSFEPVSSNIQSSTIDRGHAKDFSGLSDPESLEDGWRGQLARIAPGPRNMVIPNPFTGEDEYLIPRKAPFRILTPGAEDKDVIDVERMSKGGSIAESLAKLAKLLGRGSEEAAPAVERSAPVSSLSSPVLTDVPPGSGRSAPRDPRMEGLQSLVTNQPMDDGYYQWAVKKPNGQVHGAPFEFKGSALHVADGLNKQIPGHTVEAIPTDLSPLNRFTPQPRPVDPLKKMSAEEVDELMSRSGAGSFTDPGNGMAEGGSFDPVSSARERVSGQSSPGSPGVSGAIKDAVDALKSWMAGPRREIAAGREESIMRPAEESHADGGTTGVSTEHEQGHAGLLKRFGTRVAEQAYGLDDQGNPALGGRAWTKGQGGTPMGFLDEVTSIPHNLISLARTTRGLVDAPFAKHMPGYAQSQDNMLDSMDPQWSKDASDRLERLRQGMNRRFGVDEAQTFPEHMTDAAASLVSPVPAAGEGKAAGAAGRLIEMTMPVRPRTLKNFAQDATMMGGASTGIDALTQRLSRLRAQQTPQGGGTPVDPEHFSQDMGVNPGPQQNIRNNHQMVPLVASDGSIVFGVDPNTF
jgi:hypothetical protein